MQMLFNLFLLLLAVVNVAAFVIVGLDKRKSLKEEERYPEVSFFLLASMFGSLGIFLGMFLFRHKIRKAYFPLGIGFMLAQQIVLLWLIYKLI